MLLLAVLALLPACARDGGDGRSGPAPARLRGLEGPVHHEVALTLLLRGRPGRALDARVEVSEDGGGTFRPASVSPPGPYVLAARSEERLVTWDSEADLGRGRFEVLLRARAGPGSRAGPTRPAAIANYGFADAEELVDWALGGADPGELILADAWSFGNWAAGHLEGAISLPVDRILEEGAAALPYPRDRRLVFYCGGGT